MKILEKRELGDIILGSTLFGTGGGGSPQLGWSIIKKAMRQGGEFCLVKLNEMKNCDIVAMPYSVGSLLYKKRSFDYTEKPVIQSFELLEEYINQNFTGVIATELGGSNTARALVVGALLGKVIVDADAAGRAVPELQHSTYHIVGLPMAPFSLVTPYGDEVIFPQVRDDVEAEKIVRGIVSTISTNVGVTSHPFKVATMKNAVIPGTISQALQTGHKLRIAMEDNLNLEGVLKNLGWNVLFRGIITHIERKEQGGFTIGKFELEGIEEFKNENYQVVFRNENLISWRNGRVDITIPDLISVITPKGVPIVNSEIRKSKEYMVVGRSSPEIWRTPSGRKLFGKGYLDSLTINPKGF